MAFRLLSLLLVLLLFSISPALAQTGTCDTDLLTENQSGWLLDSLALGFWELGTGINSVVNVETELHQVSTHKNVAEAISVVGIEFDIAFTGNVRIFDGFDEVLDEAIVDDSFVSYTFITPLSGDIRILLESASEFAVIAIALCITDPTATATVTASVTPTITPTPSPTPTNTLTPTITPTPGYCAGPNDQLDTYSFVGSTSAGWTLLQGTLAADGIHTATPGTPAVYLTNTSYAGDEVQGVRWHFNEATSKRITASYNGASVVLDQVVTSQIDPPRGWAATTIVTDLWVYVDQATSSLVVIGVDVCRFVLAPTPTSTATLTGTATITATFTPTSTATITGTATSSATSTVPSTSTSSPVPGTATGTASATSIAPPGGTLPAPGGGTPGGVPGVGGVVPTPGVVVGFPTVTWSDPFGDAISPCVVPPSESFLFADYQCPFYKFPAWPGFTIQVWVYFSYLVQSLIAIWGAQLCFFGSVFNWFLFLINWVMVALYLWYYFWCMMAEFFRLLSLFLTRVWSYINLFLTATAEPGAAPTVFLGLSVTPVFSALAVMLSNPYIGAISTVVFGLLTFSMWQSILKNLSGKDD